MQILAESLTIPGSVFEEHEIPSNPGLVTPIVVKLTDKLIELGWLSRKNKGRVQLCLDEAITFGFAQKEWIENDYDFDSLRSHPRFQALLERLDADRAAEI